MARLNLRRLVLATAAVCAGSAAHAAITVATGYKVRHIPTPDFVQGGVVRDGNSILVGQGAYGAGLESVIRLEGTIGTTIATGFGSLGGFDLTAGDTLYVVDNCFTGDFGCASAVTGDTLYAIPSALTRPAPIAATAAEVLPAGSIPFASDPLVVPGAILVSDAVGPGAGRVLQVVGHASSPLISGLDYAAGLALQGGTTLLVGNSNFPTPGTLTKYSLAGVPAGTLASGLSGVYAMAIDGGGNVLVTGGLTNDFSSSTVMAVDGGGVVTERARGFSFTGDISYDAARDTALVLDFGVSEIASICGDANTDGACDADCATPVAFDKLKVTVGGLGTPAGDDSIKLSGQAQLGGPIDPVIDGVHVWVDDADAKVVLDVVVPGGAYDPLARTGWKVNGAGTSWKYRNRLGVVGITSVSVKALTSPAGRVTFKLSGKRAGYAGDGSVLPLTTGFAVGAGHCAQQAGTCVLKGSKRIACD